MSQPRDQVRAQAVADTSRIVIKQHRCARHGVRDGFEVPVQLVLRRFQEHGLQDGNAGCPVFHRHLREADAFLRVDGADAEVDRHAARRLVDHDLQAALHLVLLDLIELTVGAKSKNALHTAADHVFHLIPHTLLIDPLVLIDHGDDRDHYAFDKFSIHSVPP